MMMSHAATASGRLVSAAGMMSAAGDAARALPAARRQRGIGLKRLRDPYMLAPPLSRQLAGQHGLPDQRMTERVYVIVYDQHARCHRGAHRIGQHRFT